MNPVAQACKEMNAAALEMHACEYEEAAALARMISLSEQRPAPSVEEIDAAMCATNAAINARVMAQLRYANCRAATRLAWEQRDFPRPFSVVEAEGR